MADAIYLLTPEDKNFISHVCRNLETYAMWVNASDHPEAYPVMEDRKETAEYLVDHFLKEYHFEVTDKQQMIRVLVNGVLSDSPVDVVAVIKEIATLLDTYAASVQ
ncbi:hypothetical protein [Secundilactobacillus collinoides]|nr:hypothetical protein [Secundilactobacillus collinoides]